MKKIILHVGAHKTGTSTIQDSLINNRVILELYNIKYYASEDSLDCMLWEYLKGKESEEWHQLFKNNKFSETIISDEGLSLYSAVELSRINDLFKSMGYTICVHYFLRDPQKFKTSDCKQIISSGHGGINSSFNKTVAPRYLHFPKKLDYVFGTENTYIHKFEIAIRDNLFQYFMKECSSNSDVSKKVNETRSNSTVSDATIIAYDTLFNSNTMPCQMMRGALNKLSGESSLTFPLTEAETKEINQGLEYLSDKNRSVFFEPIDYIKGEGVSSLKINDFFPEFLISFNTYFKSFDTYIDILKTSASICEKKNELENAYKLYQLAFIIRPNGPVIRNKLRSLSLKLGKRWSGTW